MKHLSSYPDVIMMSNQSIPNLSKSLVLDLDENASIPAAPTLAKKEQDRRIKRQEVKKMLLMIKKN